MAHAIPALQFAAAAVEAEFGVFLREHGWLGGPEGMRNLQAMRGIRRAEFAGLDRERAQSRDEGQQEDRIV